MTYTDFLNRKAIQDAPTGFVANSLHPDLFPFQRALVKWALQRGRSAIFADCGMGKTFMELEFAEQVHMKTNKPVLIVAPLSVAHQTVRESEKFGYGMTRYCQDGEVKIEDRIIITNYERLEKFYPKDFSGIILDESSILKSYDGKFRNFIIENFGQVPYRLACTATPAPNDYMELGNHSQFLGVMSRTEMLSMFFVHDGGDTSKWRLKGHAQTEFWAWIAQWAVMIRKPSDIGFSDEGYSLPALNYHHLTVESPPQEGLLFAMEAKTLQERLGARRESVENRSMACAELVNTDSKSWLIWCNLNVESETITKLIPGAIQVCGSDSLEKKEKAIRGFLSGEIRVLVSKPKIFGFGMNFQHCHKMAFVGLSDSYEQLYQAIRRCWRFGQENEVEVHFITAEAEGSVVKNIARKDEDSTKMVKQMVDQLKDFMVREITQNSQDKTVYTTVKKMSLPAFLEEENTHASIR